jgi:site-specific DNA recombinase
LTREPDHAPANFTTLKPVATEPHAVAIGEVVYRGEVFRGDHEAILDPALFAAVQAKLASQAVERRCRLRGSPALLAGRIYDEHGHRMTLTHTNKKGVRYLYYTPTH